MTENILQAIDERGVATVTLNRPEAHNAIDDALILRLTETLQFLEADRTVRIIVLNAAGPSFCAGGDADWMRRVSAYTLTENVADAERLAALMRTLDRLSKPTIAVVHGATFASGVGLVACCDIAIAAESATFRLTEVNLGLVPAVISPYVVRAIGGRQARRYFQSAERIPAGRAREIGLVHEVVMPEALGGQLETCIRAILQGAPGAQAAAKDLVFLNDAHALDEALIAETARRIADRRITDEAREGLEAFLEKRRPTWRAG
ncbi:MAG TPA: enoyl-CoA hydratase-related protein [Stellaceae bacterium]|nr:enoyl-CoA hydratase-related protein [Stellaceae bacterium]